MLVLYAVYLYAESRLWDARHSERQGLGGGRALGSLLPPPAPVPHREDLRLPGSTSRRCRPRRFVSPNPPTNNQPEPNGQKKENEEKKQDKTYGQKTDHAP